MRAHLGMRLRRVSKIDDSNDKGGPHGPLLHFSL